MFVLKDSIQLWLKSFSKHQAFDEGHLREVELHLLDHIDDLLSEGYHEQAAFDLAVKEFGDIPIMAQEEMSNLKIKPSIMSFIRIRLLNNYLKTTSRTLVKNPLNSFINVFGLSVSIGVCLIVYAFIHEDINIDKFHEHKEEVFLVTCLADRDGSMQQYGQSPTPLGDRLLEDFPAISKSCRVDDRHVVIKYENKVFHERVRYVDPSFLEMFTFPLEQGQASALKDVNSIILNHDMAEKYFGDADPIGKDVLMKFSEEKSKSFVVAGVAEAFPKAHAISFGFLINFKNLSFSHPEHDLSVWDSRVNATLIQVNHANEIDEIAAHMDPYLALQQEANQDVKVSSFDFVSIDNLHFMSNNIEKDISYGTRKEGWVALSVMASFLLVLACFNYINIAIVSATKRLKEIGIRKVIGANRSMVIIQFFGENLFIMLFAVGFGLLLGVSSFIPWFNVLFSKNLEIDFANPVLWTFLTAVFLFTGLASGMYPAVYISKFHVSGILKGSVKFGKKNPLTKILLCVQLALASITISSGIWFTQNTAYISQRSWGYDPGETLFVDIPDRVAFDQLNTVMTQNPNVIQIAGSKHHLGSNTEYIALELPERKYSVMNLAVDANYLDITGLKLLKGRNFLNDHETDKQSIIINEELIKELGLLDPLGLKVKINNIKYEVVGVVQDFHVYDFDSKIKPCIFILADESEYRYLTMKVRNGKEKETFDSLQEEWATLFPEIPFQGSYQEDVFNGYFEYQESAAEFMRSLAIISVILSCLGLYGLVAVNVAGRARELSIRKVLGAKMSNFAVILAKQYVVIIAMAIIISAPSAYYLVNLLFDTMFAYHMPMNYYALFISMTILVLILLLTIASQIRKVSKSNPVDGLKVE
jgi:ABC-type antimicrobial peptide transport system permease subunit